MAIVVVKVQGSDGKTQFVPLDPITGQTYAMPIYKLAIGTGGVDSGVVSAANPLPTKLYVSGTEISDLAPMPVEAKGEDLVLETLQEMLIVLRKLELHAFYTTDEEVDEADLEEN